jgi:hypothetical protein
MFEQVPTPGLQLDEDLTFQERFHYVQRIAWVIAGLVIIAALLGLFGSGLLTGADAGDAEDGLQLHYQRFARYQAPTSVQVELTTPDPAAAQVEFWIRRSTLNHYQIESISPEPESIEVDGDRFVYTFAKAPGTSVVEVDIHLQPEEFGPSSLRMGMGENEIVNATQLVYP